ncbi:hypothetical protein STTU_2008 [Streptomyces sp. Tu6071]|nr:hypothetical protein STTU_2008 [Streptomyces sp. Tu6071]
MPGARGSADGLARRRTADAVDVRGPAARGLSRAGKTKGPAGRR